MDEIVVSMPTIVILWNLEEPTLKSISSLMKSLNNDITLRKRRWLVTPRFVVAMKCVVVLTVLGIGMCVKYSMAFAIDQIRDNGHIMSLPHYQSCQSISLTRGVTILSSTTERNTGSISRRHRMTLLLQKQTREAKSMRLI